MNHKSRGTSRADWQTPGWILDGVRQVIGGPIELDPATTDDNPTQAQRFYTPKDDGLRMPWSADSVFLNPPWSRKEGVDLKPWLIRAQEVRANAGLRPHLDMFIVISAAMNATWFHNHLADMDLFFFPRGRIRYELPTLAELEEQPVSPGFDSVLCYYGHKLHQFQEVFRPHGLVTMRLGPA